MKAVHIATSAVVEAVQTEGPCNINLGPDNGGDFCASEGQWIVYFDGQFPMVLSPEQFAAQFTIQE